MGRAGRWTVAGLVAVAAFAVATWVSGVFLVTRLLPSPDIRWPVAFGIGASAAAFAGLWGQWWATDTGNADRAADLSLEEITRLAARLGGTGAVAAAPVALPQLPPVAAGFTGRGDDLAKLRGVLDPDGVAGEVAVVTGLPGVGKTALAVKAGQDALYRHWFGAALFIDLHGYDELKVQPEQVLDALLRALLVPGERIPPDLGARQALYRSEVAKMATVGKSVLVIADDASAESQIQPLLLGIREHKVVVTSRRTLENLSAPLVDLTALDITAGVEVLKKVLQEARADDDRIAGDRPTAWRRLAEACAGLPLALQIVAGRLKAHPNLRLPQLADELSDEKERLGALQGDDGLRSVTAAFQLSYRQLGEITKRVFRMLSVNPGPDLSTEAVEVLTELPERKVVAALSELEGEHLIEAVPRVQGRWRMHDLLRLYAQLQSQRHADTDAPEPARERLFQFYLATARDADKRLQAPVKAVPGKFNSQDDALDWFHAERPNLVATVKMADRTGPNQVAIDLPLALGHYFYRRRRFDDWLATLAISRKAAGRSPCRNKNKKGESLTQLGWALGEQRQFEEAINACQDAVKIFERTRNQRAKAGALTNLGHALRGRDRFDEAIKAYQAAGNIYERTGDRRGSGIVLTNLGLAQARVGHLQEAKISLQEAKISHTAAVAIFQKEIGDRLEEGAALTNLGHILRDLGELDQAITACQEAVKAYQDTTDRHGEGNALDQLGLTLQEAMRPEKAIIEHEKAIAIFRETNDRHGEGIALSNVGLAYRKVRRFEDAITACQAAVAIFRETTDPYSEGIALGRLGLALQGVQRFEKAADAHQRNLEICADDDWHGQAEVLNNLGMALQRSGRFEEAAKAHRDAAAIFRKHDDRPGLALTYSQLGLLAGEQHNPGQALEWAVRCVALFDDVPHPGAGTGPGQLALLTHQLGTAALEARWQQVTGGSLPAAVRDYVCSYSPDPGDTPGEAGR